MGDAVTTKLKLPDLTFSLTSVTGYGNLHLCSKSPESTVAVQGDNRMSLSLGNQFGGTIPPFLMIRV
jgi:hypothetical protein